MQSENGNEAGGHAGPVWQMFYSQSEAENVSSTTRPDVDNRTEHRMNKVRKYWLKKHRRITAKKVRYGCRQNLARQRFRFQGRFITKAEMEKLDPEQIYDPNVRFAPRVKQIFKITKEHNKSMSCRSCHSNSGLPDWKQRPLLADQNQSPTCISISDVPSPGEPHPKRTGSGAEREPGDLEMASEEGVDRLVGINAQSDLNHEGRHTN